MTLVEVMLSLTFMTVAMLSLVSTLTQTIRVQESNRELDLAVNTARSVIETIRSYPDFRGLFRAYNENPLDDPNGPGSGPGAQLSFTYGAGSIPPFTSLSTALHQSIAPIQEDPYRTSILPPDPTTPRIGNQLLPGAVVRIEFPGDGRTLREDVRDVLLGLPRDINGDGKIDALDHANDYVILPLTLRVMWNAADGPRSYVVRTFLTNLP